MSRVRLCARYGWTLLRSRKNDLPVSNFASPWLKVEGSDAIDDHRGSAAVPVHEHIAFGRDLGHEDMAFIVTASTVGDLVDQEDASLDRKSTRLNSSHQIISYAVFCLKKKNPT